MHVEMENVIKKLEQYIKDDEVTYEFDDAIEELKQLDLGLSSVESLLGFMEKHPFTDFGMPGEIVHYMERFYRHGYEELLMKSIERRPTIHTLFMMNRLGILYGSIEESNRTNRHREGNPRRSTGIYRFSE